MFTSIVLGQTFDVKDRNGVPMVTISDVKMFRHESKQDIPSIRATVTNVSGETLKTVQLAGIVRKKDGSTVSFWLDTPVISCSYCIFRKDSVTTVKQEFPEPWPFTEQDFESVSFVFSDAWQSPQERRVQLEKAAEEQKKADEIQAKKDADELARRKRDAAEQKKKDAERDARIAKERAAESARAAEERRKARVSCSGIYENTIDKKVGDLTVREEQQVRACQALGLYLPR
jgi:hypothetical protein